ncbi:hypothetical protein [Delftia sp. 60]|uniref:hypothetical protein n=1 Tax=Delftia sp. 60 TaxID=2035216 RepID=UPI0015D52018|nr:hypothetical protein [Delftia sp. 60]
MTIKESIQANVSAVLMAVILIWFSRAIQSQSCPYMPSHPAVFIAWPMGSEPGSVALNAAGLARLHAQPDLLQLFAAVGEGSDTCLLEQPAQYLHGQEPDLSPFQFPPEQALAFNEVDLGFHLFLGLQWTKRANLLVNAAAAVTPCQRRFGIAGCRLPLGPMARAIGHAARQAAAAGCGGGWWSG